MLKKSAITCCIFILINSPAFSDICDICLLDTLQQGYCYNPFCEESIIPESARQRDITEYYPTPPEPCIPPDDIFFPTREERVAGAMQMYSKQINRNLLLPYEVCEEKPEQKVLSLNPVSLCPLLSELSDLIRQSSLVRKNGITRWLRRASYDPVEIDIDMEEGRQLQHINSLLYISSVILVVTLTFDQTEEHLFIETDDDGNVFAFSDNDDFLPEIQHIADPSRFIMESFSEYDPEVDDISAVCCSKPDKQSPQPQALLPDSRLPATTYRHISLH
ncbi:hypothetical protein ACWJJH_20675 [Endozoicomonadaceae bacterium StTr2]